MNLNVNINFVSQNCPRVSLSPVWRRHNVTSDRPPLLLLTPLQVRPPFLVLMGIVLHMLSMNQIFFYYSDYLIVIICVLLLSGRIYVFRCLVRVQTFAF